MEFGAKYGISPSKYVQEAVRNCEIYLKEKFLDEYDLTCDATNPFPMNYEPSMDTSDMLEPEHASYYQTIIRGMRWMVEIGRIDITTKVSQLSSFFAMPRRRHLANALHVMSYLKIKHNSMLVLDPTYPDIEID